MQQDHSALFVDVKKDSRDSVLSQVRPHLIDPATHGLQTGIPIGQPNSTVLIFLSDAFPIFRRKPLQPVPHRLATSLGAIEDGWNRLALSFKRLRRGTYACRGFGFLAHRNSVPHTVHIGGPVEHKPFRHSTMRSGSNSSSSRFKFRPKQVNASICDFDRCCLQSGDNTGAHLHVSRKAICRPKQQLHVSTSMESPMFFVSRPWMFLIPSVTRLWCEPPSSVSIL